MIIFLSAITLLQLKILRQNFDLVYGFYNGIGHLLYLFLSSLLVVFIVREGLDKPYNIMFRTVYEKSIRDTLTELYNQNGLEELAHASRASRRGRRQTHPGKIQETFILSCTAIHMVRHGFL